ncbi:uncharacterized protein BJ171DRAFT_437248 [Polychytrium aggregatum]|uniref:uncharacterized protein n=1 Tax=Polychytrium aggregatum TaxID=110093 RepID=UPI0022FDCD85|nr:uncharacterized protein BJ171DRAFT_437248 [Polychytrium aggregatum]KAI9209270.1 hypothetical protein BJ171DRAFT_437248 [Polychytrium aggregatum]
MSQSTSNSTRFSLQTKKDWRGEFRQLLRREYYITRREPASFVSSFILSLYFVFLLFILKKSLQVLPGDPVPTPLPFLTSICDASSPNCVHIGYTNSTPVGPLISQLSALLSQSEPSQTVIRNFNSPQDMNNYKQSYPSQLVVGIEFTNVSGVIQPPPAVPLAATPLATYVINVNETSLTTSNFVSGMFVTAQSYVEYALINTYRNNRNLPLLRSPLAYTATNGIYTAKAIGSATGGLQYTLSFITIFMFQKPLESLLLRITFERTKDIKSGLIMIGMNPIVYHFSLIASVFVMQLPIFVIVGVLFFVLKVFTLTSPLVFAVLLILYLLLMLNLAAVVALAVPKHTMSVLVSFLVDFLSLAMLGLGMVFFWDKPGLEYAEYLALFFFPLVSIGRATGLMAQSEDTLVGISFNGSLPAGLQRVLIMMVVDIVVYGILGLYLSLVFVAPDQQGLEPLFFLKQSYWFPNKTRILRSVDPLKAATTASLQDPDNFEPVDVSYLPVSDLSQIQILGISQVFKKRKSGSSDEELKAKSQPRRGLISSLLQARVKAEPFTAVDNVSLNMHGGQIVALLGHNGAGKSTLINMIMGSLRPTRGDILVAAPSRTTLQNAEAAKAVEYLSVLDTHSLEEIRSRIGVCHQFDMLYPVMTPREHIELVLAIKGVVLAPGQNGNGTITEYIEALLKDVGLDGKFDQWCQELSGGQKRKLSVAMALAGNPKLVLLDEPTTGMDVHSTQEIWRFIQALKPGRVILLTTHMMDEAEVLGDQIVVVNKGKMQVSGTSMFLKSKFGIGYHLLIERSRQAHDGHSDVNGEDEAILKLIQTIVPEAAIEQNTQSSLTILLPFAKITTAEAEPGSEPTTSQAAPSIQNDEVMLSQLFTTLRSHFARIQASPESKSTVHSVGLSQTTLDEVFLKLKDDAK